VSGLLPPSTGWAVCVRGWSPGYSIAPAPSCLVLDAETSPPAEVLLAMVTSGLKIAAMASHYAAVYTSSGHRVARS